MALLKKNQKSIFIITTLFIFSGLFFSCGSKPKREMEITIIHSNAKEMLESANTNILSGDYEKAKYFLNLSYNQAMTVDDFDLLTSITLAYVSLNLSYNPPLTEEAEKYLEKAKIFAKYSVNNEKQTALCVLNETRIKIADSSDTIDYNSLIDKLDKYKKSIKEDPYNEAQFDSARGDIFRVQKNYSKAEDSYEQAVKLYTDNCYLSELGITWYKIAQVRSLNNKKTAALEALDKAIFYDRAAENTLALGTDYYVKGLILLKGNPSLQDKEDAKFSFTHSTDIFTAAGDGMKSMAEKSRKAAEEL